MTLLVPPPLFHYVFDVLIYRFIHATCIRPVMSVLGVMRPLGVKVLSEALGKINTGVDSSSIWHRAIAWWRHQMETFSALLALCAGNSPVTGEFPSQRPVTQSFDVFFDLRLNKRLSKQSWGWWFETPSRSLWRHCNEMNECWLMVIWFPGNKLHRNSNSKISSKAKVI